MFPDPELLGVDPIIPDPTYVQQSGARAALVLTHGHEDHIGGVPHVAAAHGRPGLRHAADARARRTEAARTRARRDRPSSCRCGRATRRRSDRSTIEFIRVTHSIPDCVALAIHTPVGIVVHTGDFKIDQTPIDGEHFDIHRFASSARQGVLALFADSTNVDRRGFTGPRPKSWRRSRKSSPARTGRWSWPLRVEHLSDADPRGSGGAVRSQGRVRRPRHDRELARSRSVSATCGFPPACRSRLGCPQLSAAGHPVSDDRLAGRADVGVVADRHRRPSAREARPRRHRRAVGPRHPREREGDWPRHRPRRAARRRRHLRRDQTRARIGSRQRGRAQTDALAGPPAVFHPRARGISATVAACAHRRAVVRGTRATAGDSARRERRFARARRQWAPGSRERRRSAAC